MTAKRVCAGAIAVAALGLAGCAGLGRSPPQPATATPAEAAPAVDDVDTVNAEARRILQTRAFERLTESVRDAETQAVRDALAGQVEAWNRGDVQAFMAGYWRSPDLSMASAATLIRGWGAVLRRYETKYPGSAAMGRLTLSDLEIEILSPEAATAFGRWRIVSGTDVEGGLFTLILHKVDGRWVITRDHTSTGG